MCDPSDSPSIDDNAVVMSCSSSSFETRPYISMLRNHAVISSPESYFGDFILAFDTFTLLVAFDRDS